MQDLVIDWSKAPEGATHYSPEIPSLACAAFWRENNGRLVEFWSVEGGAFKHRVNAEGYCKTPDECIPRPTTPSWSGEGLPPVGAVCEVDGERVVIVAHHCNGTQAIYAESVIDGLLYYGDPGEFRPIRTPEQIAADERDEAIKRACADIDKLVAAYNMSIDCSAAIRATIEALHDAGYRKP